MLIICPSCATSYNVDLASLQPKGRKVRCVRCRRVWHAELNQAEQPVAAATALEPNTEMAPDPAAAAVAVREALRPSRPAHEQTPAGGFDLVPTAAENGAAGEAASDMVDVQAPPIAVEAEDGRPPIDIDADRASTQHDEAQRDIETYASRRHGRTVRRASLHWPLSQLQSCIVALLIVDAVLIACRKDVVRALPQTAAFYAAMGLSVNLRGLEFDGVTTATHQDEGVPVLVVEGNIVNDTYHTVAVPRLKFAVRNNAGAEIYSWTAVPPRTALPPGESAAFRARLASPPLEARDVLVRFVTGGDVVAGMR